MVLVEFIMKDKYSFFYKKGYKTYKPLVISKNMTASLNIYVLPNQNHAFNARF